MEKKDKKKILKMINKVKSNKFRNGKQRKEKEIENGKQR